MLGSLLTIGISLLIGLWAAYLMRSDKAESGPPEFLRKAINGSNPRIRLKDLEKVDSGAVIEEKDSGA